MKIRYTANGIADACAGLILAGVLFLSLYFSLNGYVEFDEGFLLQVPQSLLSTHAYATSYNGGRLFDPLITTGPTVLLPIALVFFLNSGTSLELARLVMACYLLGAFVAAWLLSRALFGNLAGLLTVLLWACLPYLANFGTAVLGEMAAVFFCVLAVVCLRRRQTGLAGLLVGLAILTKTIFFFAGLALAASLLLDWLFNFKKNTARWKSFAAILGSGLLLLLPNLAWELVKFLGLGWAEYQRNFADFLRLFAGNSAGSGEIFPVRQLARIQVLAGPFQSISDWARAISDCAPSVSGCVQTISGGVVLLVLAASFAWGFFQLYRHSRRTGFTSPALAQLFLLIFSMLFLGWWILGYNTGWWRHLMPGMMLAYFPLGAFLAGLVEWASNQVRKLVQHFTFPRLLVVILGELAAALLLVWFGLQPVGQQLASLREQASIYPISRQVQREVARQVLILAQTGGRVGGWGWWQSPEISILAGQNFIDLNTPAVRDAADLSASKQQDVYLLVSPVQSALDPTAWDQEKKFAGEMVYSNADYHLYRYIPQDDNATQFKYLSLREDIGTFSSEYSRADPSFKSVQIQRGFYEDSWVAKSSALWLKVGRASTRLVVRGSVPLENYPGQPFRVKIYAMNTLLSEQTFTHAGKFTWDIPLPGSLASTPIMKITFQANQFFIPKQLGINSDRRELSFRLDQVSLK